MVSKLGIEPTAHPEQQQVGSRKEKKKMRETKQTLHTPPAISWEKYIGTARRREAWA
jgi:hypothetical protein